MWWDEIALIDTSTAIQALYGVIFVKEITKTNTTTPLGKKMKPTTRRSTIALLASSLLLTIGRGATLPFMTIYLTRQYAMTVDTIGYAMSIALVVGVIFSLGFGILADKFDKKRYMLIAVMFFIAGFVAIPLVNSIPLVVFFFALLNCSYSGFSTVLKAYFSDSLAAWPPAPRRGCSHSTTHF